ncbi:hypothetical protein GCM10022380_04140 [Amycolatopsis tucumanensis]|uniref:Uncharacterized protein n=1 Tax=Amycolatopsis tucumanensis TaxID=401106 RepID=A0ABP7HF25_9PSEU
MAHRTRRGPGARWRYRAEGDDHEHRSRDATGGGGTSHRRRGHGGMMLLMCAPLLVIAIVLMLTGVAGAAMVAGMSRGGPAGRN